MLFEFLDTPGDEVAPGSDEIGKDFKNQWLRHCGLLGLSFRPFQSFQTIKRPERNRYYYSMFVRCRKSKGFEALNG